MGIGLGASPEAAGMARVNGRNEAWAGIPIDGLSWDRILRFLIDSYKVRNRRLYWQKPMATNFTPPDREKGTGSRAASLFPGIRAYSITPSPRRCGVPALQTRCHPTSDFNFRLAIRDARAYR